jgi:hypothetical protein
MQPERNQPISRQDDPVTEQDRVDEAMFESFPASDPPSWNAGLSHEQAHAAGDANEDEVLTRLAQKLDKTDAEIEILLVK